MGICVTGSKGMLSCRFPNPDKDPQPLRFSNAPCSPVYESFCETIDLLENRMIPGAEPLEIIKLAPIFYEAGRYAVWDLMQAIEEDRQPITNIYDAQAALEMIYGVYTSHLSGSTVYFPMTDTRHPLEKFIK